MRSVLRVEFSAGGMEAEAHVLGKGVLRACRQHANTSWVQTP